MKNRSMRRGTVVVHSRTTMTRADLKTGGYRYGGTGSAPVEYVLSGVTHRFDGTCHDGCEDVR